ncbi:MAG: hypothetical protein V3W31_10015 [Thermodesulfobacteriota bacterium]
MLKRFTALGLFLLVISPWYVAEASDEEWHNLSRVINPVSQERFTVYEVAIVPWLQREFVQGMVVEDGAVIKRGLVRTDLMRFEHIEGQDRYNVHIEYRVFIRDPSGIELSGLKGQEIVFWIVDGQVYDYYPFNEYWITETVLQERDYY